MAMRASSPDPSGPISNAAAGPLAASATMKPRSSSSGRQCSRQAALRATAAAAASEGAVGAAAAAG